MVNSELRASSVIYTCFASIICALMVTIIIIQWVLIGIRQYLFVESVVIVPDILMITLLGTLSLIGYEYNSSYPIVNLIPYWLATQALYTLSALFIYLGLDINLSSACIFLCGCVLTIGFLLQYIKKDWKMILITTVLCIVLSMAEVGVEIGFSFITHKKLYLPTLWWFIIIAISTGFPSGTIAHMSFYAKSGLHVYVAVCFLVYTTAYYALIRLYGVPMYMGMKIGAQSALWCHYIFLSVFLIIFTQYQVKKKLITTIPFPIPKNLITK